MAHIITNGDNSVTVFGDIAPEYVRTDRNGTKIYHNVNCPRCAGAGRSDHWWRTGCECYACGGTGRRTKPLEVKVYTKEYQARLEARRAAKAVADAADEDELRRLAEETKRNRYKNWGFTGEGLSYVYQGDTYRHREAFRKAGARFAYGRWFSPVPVECGIEPVVVNAEGTNNGDHGWDPWDVIEAYGLPRL